MPDPADPVPIVEAAVNRMAFGGTSVREMAP